MPRGPLTELLLTQLRRQPDGLPDWTPALVHMLEPEDLHLALHLAYGLHYDGFAGVDDAWEWEPSLLALTTLLEKRFLTPLVEEVTSRGAGPDQDGDLPTVIGRVRHLLGAPGGPSLSAFMQDHGDREMLREFVLHRSIYQRKEADPHTWAIPRLRGAAKSAMVTLQADEYGGGAPGRSHAELFAHTMMALDLDPTPGAHIDQVPGVTLATDNLVSLFGLHRRWRGALVGHLAAFEMTSVVPMGRYAQAVRNILDDEVAAEFYDVHVEADVHHEVIAVEDLITGLAATDPEALRDVPFGVAALTTVEARMSQWLLSSWSAGVSSLRQRDATEPTPFAAPVELLSA
jgi:Iron-containing redox enzyme